MIDAEGLHYRQLNEQIRAAADDGADEIVLDNVMGQRYIGTCLGEGVHLRIKGVPGNDLAAFMNGADVIVEGNAQDGVANTMNAGCVTIHGDAGDILAHSMRGGQVLVRGNVGYRTGIHMKAYEERQPTVVIGGTAGDYLGEYMAGGVLLVLRLGNAGDSSLGECIGTGMHGGAIYIRGEVAPYRLGREVGVETLTDDDWTFVQALLRRFDDAFALNGRTFTAGDFVKLTPKSSRPYGTLYAY
jgi:glutamate synthase domain-containing protein 3